MIIKIDTQKGIAQAHGETSVVSDRLMAHHLIDELFEGINQSIDERFEKLIDSYYN